MFSAAEIAEIWMTFAEWRNPRWVRARNAYSPRTVSFIDAQR
jgi:hypothetical protein